jgi:hypothetical protein
MERVYCIHRVTGAWRPNGQGVNFSLTDPKKMSLKILISRLLYKLHIR